MDRSAQTSLFLRRVRDFVSPLPPRVTPDTPCLTVVQRMREERAPWVLVIDDSGRIAGIISTGDVLHQVTFTAEASTPARAVMTQPVHTVRADLPLFRAVALMRDRGLRHLPVLDQQDHPQGMLLVENILSPLLGKQLSLVESIASDHEPDRLRHAKRSQIELAEVLLEQRVPTPEIMAVLTTLNDESYRRTLEWAIEGMIAEGWGEPPVAFAAVVTGSAGRWESLLRPDQDNGFVLADYPDERYPRINDYFIELAQRMTLGLDTVGIPLCIGYVMATNHAWRKRLGEWQAQFLNWMRNPSEASTTLLDIWIDFRGVFGAGDLVATLRDFVTANLSGHHGFLRELEVLQFDHDVAITPFWTLKRERMPGQEGHRKIDIKRKGLRPLLEGVRILALRAGIPATETLERLAALRQQGVLKADLADAVRDAFELLTELLLREQIRAHHQARLPGAYVTPEALTPWERRRLKTALHTVARLRGMVHMEFTGEIF
jgi:signal-transduction protein with cAMP-binding, CBS, and nucleotidyltransferase domain